MADVMDIEEAGVLDAFVTAGSELQRTQVAPEADALTFSEIAGHEGVTVKTEDLSSASAEDLLKSLRDITSEMDERQVSTGSRYLFITPTLNGVIQDFSYANPIFFHWRHATRWAEESLTSEENREWFVVALSRLKELTC